MGLASGIISIAIIAWIVIQLHALGTESTLYIKNVSGDPSVLNDVVVSGLIQDKYHGQKFSITNDNVSQAFKAYTHYLDGQNGDSAEQEQVVNEEKINEFSIRRGSRPDDLGSRRRKNIYAIIEGSFGEMVYHTGVTTRSWAGNEEHNLYRIVKGELYFTVDTDYGDNGKNGIFKVKDFYHQESDQQVGKVDRIFTIDLDETNDVRVYGLEVVNDKIILITSGADELKLYLFNPKNGALEDMQSIKVNEELINHYVEFKMFTNDNRLNIYFKNRLSQTPEQLENESTNYFNNKEIDIITLKVTDTIDVENRTNVVFDRDRLVLIEVEDIVYIKDKLYFAALAYDHRRYPHKSQYNHYIFAYKGNEDLYKGQLSTDIFEDYGTEMRNEAVVYDRIMNPINYDYRKIDHLTIEAK